MKDKTKKITLLGIFTCFALVLSYIELLIPPIWSAVPGIKIGLPNIIIVFILYKSSFKDAVRISIIRILITAILFGNAYTLIYSLSGAILSLFIMFILKKTNKFSYIGVSISGAVSHNLGQIIAASILMRTKEIFYYMIVLSCTGIIAGIAVGILAIILLKYFEKLKI